MATRQAAGTGAFTFLRKRAFARPHFSRGPKIVAIVAFVLVALLGAASAWAIQYDNRTIEVFPKDTVIGGVNVGGLRYQPAVDKVRAQLEAPLPTPLDVDRAKTLLNEGVQRGDKQIHFPVVHPKAAVQSDAFATVILVRTGENKLYLYKNGQVARTYDVATGRPEFPTPTGQFRVVSKQTNPTWHNPHSSWSTSMPETIGAGPTNPLGTHALALSASGILIHETPDVGSIGTSASHGCIRMRGGDEDDLFNQVSTGTTVVILNAATPKARTNTPNPTSADQNAAAN